MNRTEALPLDPAAERRGGADRRKRTWHALWYGNIHRRRRAPRRIGDRSVVAVDWHHPQWLAVSILILVASVVDALLTLTLLPLGASEANPVMARVVTGSGLAFAITKLSLTSAGLVALVLLARLRAFGGLPVGLILYAVLAGYAVLIVYELSLLDRLTAFG